MLSVYGWVLTLYLLCGAAALLALLFIPAFYGRYSRTDRGPTVSNRTGWLVMEAPAALAFPLVYYYYSSVMTPMDWALVLLWSFHYVYRAFVYPFKLRNPDKPMPLLIVAMAIVFNCANGWLMGAGMAANNYTISWLYDPRFIVGALLFFLGLFINRNADATLMALRAQGESGYKIPFGGLYAYISCPNFFGEIVQWIGWALLTWSVPGAAFAFFTAANIGPRAVSHHRWYRSHFADYPPQRKALIPFVL